MESPRTSPAEQKKHLRTRTERLLKKIDFELLHTLFAEEVRKSGLNPDHTNLITPSDGIKLEAVAGPADARYMILDNEIMIDYEKISTYPSGESSHFEMEVFGALCHEEAHAVSRDPHITTTAREFFKYLLNKPVLRGGVAYMVRSEEEMPFNLLNEAITDTIAEEVYEEYLRRSGDRARLFGHGDPVNYRQTYLYERNILKAFIAALSRATDIPEDVVWSGMKQSYFSNADLGNRELTDLYEEVLRVNVAKIVKLPEQAMDPSRDTIYQLDRIGTNEVEALAKELAESVETMSWSGALKKKAVDALQKLTRSGASGDTLE